MPIREQSRILPATHSGPRPGDYLLGSQQSRAAARAILDARLKLEAETGQCMRVMIRPVIGDTDLTRSTCQRSRMADGRILEFLQLDGSGSDLPEAALDAWAKSFPLTV